ncbi:MAG: hypothetical protein JWR61_3322 [Ferruginibacter sp.]|nr:hypothetical protein [Ferruginibacter sp.]MDB5278367.1 hypothetical protein [Ferruginibacter sp.]
MKITVFDYLKSNGINGYDIRSYGKLCKASKATVIFTLNVKMTKN